MVASWVVVGLLFSAFSVSTLGAAFSIFGLRDLFSGAALSVILMASALELAKFTLAAYLHQRWYVLNKIFKGYLVGAVAVLSIITSMGIYGHLSNAYQSASSVLEGEQIKLSALQGQLERHNAEIARLNRTIDEIPASRVTKRMEARKEIEPAIAEMNRSVATVSSQIDASNLKVLEVKMKVGPLIYISKAFKVDIDNVVKYLILLLVLVFDPLAISLVIASSEALQARGRKEAQPSHAFAPTIVPEVQTPPAQPPVTLVPPPDGQVVHMRFASEPKEQPKVSKDEKAV